MFIVSLEQKDHSLSVDFQNLKSWEDRYSKIIHIGKSAPGLPDNEKTEDLKVRGCQSQVWIKAQLTPQGKLEFQADSDALIVKGLVSMLAQLFSGESPNDVLNYQPQFIEKIGLRQNLSPSRANGLVNMLKQMKFYALAYQSSLSEE